MTRSFLGLAWAMVGATILGAPAMAQEKKSDAALSSAPACELPRPGPEHAILKADAGTWDVEVSMKIGPDEKPEVSKGVETVTLLADGLWVKHDFVGTMMGQPYEGHIVSGYDFQKKKYVGSWIDSMSPGFTNVEGTYDPATKTLSQKLAGPCPNGQWMEYRATVVWKDANSKVVTLYSPKEMGPEFAMMTMTYKRRAANP